MDYKNIFLIGIDGSGKTTHSIMLRKKLLSMGINAKYMYMRGYDKVFFTLPILVLSKLLGVTKVYTTIDGTNISFYRFNKNVVLKRVWPWVSFIDSLLFTIFSFYLAPLNNCINIVDRGAIDTFVDVISDTRNYESFIFFFRLYIRLIPKKSIIIVLDVDENIVFNRKRDVLNLDYLKIRKKIYCELASYCGWMVINTNDDIVNVHNKIMKLLNINIDYKNMKNEIQISKRKI